MRSRVMFLGFLIAGLLTGLCLLVSCGGKSGDVVARGRDVKITAADYNRQYLEISPPRRPRNMDTMEGKRRFLDDLINKEIMASEAKKRGFSEDPGLVEAMKALTDQKILDVLRNEGVEDKIKFEPGEIRAFYDKQGQQYRVGLLVFQDRTRAEKVQARIRGGASFKDLAGESVIARMYPDADLGWRTWGEFEEPLNSALFALKPGETTDLIPMQGDDLVLATVFEVRPNEELGSFEDMRSGMRDKLTSMKRRTLSMDWTTESIKKYRVTLDEDQTAKILDRLVWNMDAAGQEIRPAFSPEEENAVLGTYEGGRMTVGSLVDEVMQIPLASRPNSGMGLQEFDRFLKVVLMNKALLADGYAQRIQDRPEVRSQLDRTREERMVTMLYDSIVKDVTVTSADIEEYYENYKDSLRNPEQYEVSRIVTQSEEASKAARQAIRSGKPFEDVARARSIDRAARNGGKLSPATVDVFPPAVRELVVSLKVGELGGPVHTDDGWMLIRLDGHSAERQLSLDETRDTIRMQLLQLRQGEVFDAWLAQKRQELGIEVFDNVLEKIQLVQSRPDAETEVGKESGN
jgi:peptidyl-prolyl cis-trans isomerase C